MGWDDTDSDPIGPVAPAPCGLRDIVEAASGRRYDVWWWGAAGALDVSVIEDSLPVRYDMDATIHPHTVRIERIDWPRGCWIGSYFDDGDGHWVGPRERPLWHQRLCDDAGRWRIDRKYLGDANVPDNLTYIEAVSWAVGRMELAYVEDAIRRLEKMNERLSDGTLIEEQG